MDPETSLDPSLGHRPKRIRRRLWASSLGALLLIATATVFAGSAMDSGGAGGTGGTSGTGAILVVSTPPSVDTVAQPSVDTVAQLSDGPIAQPSSGVGDPPPSNPGDQGQGAGPPGPYGHDDDLPTTAATGGDQPSGSSGAGGPCEEPPASCCEYGDQGLFAAGSVLYESQDQVISEHVQLFTQPPLAHRAVLDDSGNPVFVDQERTIRVPLYRPCVDTCGGHEVASACECRPARCCEDESMPGSFYKAGSVLNAYEKGPDGKPHLIKVEACPTPRCAIQSVGFCPSLCPSGIVAPMISGDMQDPEKAPEKEPRRSVIRCDECPDSQDGDEQLCDPCPPLVTYGDKSEAEVEKWCKERGWDNDLKQVAGDTEAFYRKKRAEVEQQVKDAEAAYEALTREVNQATRTARAIIDQADTLASSLGGLSSPPHCGFASALLLGDMESYFDCLKDWANDLAAKGKVTGTQASAFIAQIGVLRGQVQSIVATSKSAIENLRKAKETLATDFDKYINDALATMGLPAWKEQCKDRGGEELEDCLGFILDKVGPIILRQAKMCEHLGKPTGPQCQVRYCQGNAERKLEAKMDLIEEALPAGGLGIDEYPSNPCCTKVSADFLVNSAPKEWKAGQFFTKSTKLGTFGFGWSAKAGRNLWVTIGDTGAYAYLAGGAQYLLPKLPLINGVPLFGNPACSLDGSPWNQACTDITSGKQGALLKLNLGTREWLASAAGSAYARIRTNTAGKTTYEGHLKAELKLFGDRVWALPSGPGSPFEIKGSFTPPEFRVEFELFDKTLFSYAYSVFTPIPFFVEAGVKAKGLAFAEAGLAKGSFGLRAYAGVGVAVGGYLQGGIGVSLFGGRLKIAAGLDATLLIARFRVGAAIEGGARQLPPSPDPKRQVVLAGYCFGIPYEMRMLDGEVSVFATITLKVWRFKIHKEWRKVLWKWDGVGLSGFLWKRCETKCYAYEGASPYDKEYKPFDAMTPPDVLPGPDRPPCWPHFTSKLGISGECLDALAAAGLTLQKACFPDGDTPPVLPSQCAGSTCAKLQSAGGTLLGAFNAGKTAWETFEDDWKIYNPTKAATWKSAIEEMEDAVENIDAAYQSAKGLSWLPPMSCKLAVGVKKTPAYIACMKAWYADAKAAALALPGTDPAFLALQAELDSYLAIYDDALADYLPLEQEMEAAWDLGKAAFDGVTGDCTCDRDLSDLAVKESPLRFVCGGATCGGTVCNAPCGAPYHPTKNPTGTYYPDDPSVPPFSDLWPACCGASLPKDFGNDCSPK